MRHDQGRALRRLYDIGDGEGLAGAGGAQQRLMLVPLMQAGQQALDGGGLVAGRREGRIQLEFGHIASQVSEQVFAAFA